MKDLRRVNPYNGCTYQRYTILIKIRYLAENYV